MVLSALALGALISTTGAARYILGGVLAMASIGVWLNAQRFVAHWSTSGELFLAQPDNDVIRIALADGDGLAPLRFSETLPADCEGGVCSAEAPSDILLTMQTVPEPVVCFRRSTEPARNAEPGCVAAVSEGQVTWRWADIAAQSRVTLYVKDGAFRQVRAPVCGRRPWHPCLSILNVSEE